VREIVGVNQYRELQIKAGRAISIDALGKAIDACLGEGWERTTPDVPPGLMEEPDKWLFYACDRRGKRAAALLAICRSNDRTFYVPNVVPNEKSELSFEDYTAVLKNFHDVVLAKLSNEFTVVLVMESGGDRGAGAKG
jgi:hypothetical protein